MTKWPTAETDVAAPVVAWLRAAGWDVYQEVRKDKGEKSCDIVAARGPLLWAVEVKVRLGAEVVEQARWWRQYAHYASVAVPYRQAGNANAVIDLALRAWGLGVFGVRDPSQYYSFAPEQEQLAIRVAHERKPALNRHARADSLRGYLCEEQKTYLQAGSACGGGWSPYKATCAALLDLVQRHPGCTLREAIAGRKPTMDSDCGWPGIKHHYATDSTAIGSLRVWIEQGKVPGIRMERDGRRVRLYMGEAERT